MKRKLQIFISSTYSDLIAERQDVVEAVLRAGHIPAGMELFAAGNESQLEIIKRWIDDSDIYMLILGGRYGSIDSKSGLSYTELEYRYAVETNKPSFAIVASDSYLDKKIREKGQDSKDVLEFKNGNLYAAFKEAVMSKICRAFKSSEEIKIAVLESLIDIQNRFHLDGWIKAKEIPSVTEFASQIKELKDQNYNLLERLKTFESGQINKIGKYTFDLLEKALNDIEIIIPASIASDGVTQKKTALNVFLDNKDAFGIGLSNHPNSSEASHFLINNIAVYLKRYELIDTIKMLDGQQLRYQTSKLGNKFLALYSLKKILTE